MSIRQIGRAMSEDAHKFVYHCAMCDIEIKQSAPHPSNALLEPTASIGDSFNPLPILKARDVSALERLHPLAIQYSAPPLSRPLTERRISTMTKADSDHTET
jgi:hypothetical protein